MIKKLAGIIVVLILASCRNEQYKSVDNGFDAACLIFQEAGTKNLDPVALGIYIAKKLDEMPEIKAANDVRATYHALFNADPAIRYDLFKQSAEISLKRNWDCSAVKQIYQ